MDPDIFEATQRQREWFHTLTVPSGLWAVIRVDGRGFSKLTAARFTKPYDERFRDHMLAAANALMSDFDGSYGYTQSDEISLVLPPSFDRFGRSLEKLVSLSAGLASAAFTTAAGVPAHFDARVSIAVSADDVVDYVSWRQSDAARSALNNWCYWTLRGDGKTAREATTRLDRLSTSAKNELLFEHGINFNEVPSWQRRGVDLRWIMQDRVGVDPRTGATQQTVRRVLRHDLDLPMKDAFRASLVALLDQVR